MLMLFLALPLFGCGGGGSSPNSSGSAATRTLVIDVLGDGVVTSANDSSLSCDSHGEFNYTEGKSLNLTASAAPGASFSHWTGCDTVSGEICTVTIDSDRNVSPSFIKPIIYQVGVVQLDATAMSHLLAKTETSLTFSSSIADYAPFALGDVLVSNVVTAVAEGLLRKVISIEESNGELHVTTEPAMIEDVILNGTLASKTVLTPDNTVVTALAIGVKPAEAVSKEFEYTLNDVLLDDDGNLETLGDQLKLTGTFSSKITVDAGVDVGFTGVKSFKLTMESSNTANLVVTAEGTIGEKEIKKTLVTYYAPPIALGPFVIVPKIALIVKAKGSIGAKVSSSVNIGATVVGGVIYRKDSGWSPLSSFAKDFAYTPPTAQVTVNSKTSIGPELSTMICDLAGPNISLAGSLSLKGGASTDLVGGNTNYSCSLTAGLSSTAGAKLAIINWTLAEASFNLFEYEKTLYTCPQDLSLDKTNPTAPQNLTIPTLLSTSASLAWGEGTDNVAVTGYEIYQDTTLIETNVTSTWYKAMRLLPSTRYCFQVKAFDAAGNRSPLSNEVCATTPSATTSLYTLSGTIHSGSNAGPALAGATVTIAGKSALSSSSGSFALSDIPAGTYALSVAKAGYETYTNPAYFVDKDQGGLNFYLIIGSSGASRLPDTGQTNCYDTDGFVINCAGTGQDGEYSINPMSFTDNGNGTVRDNVTALIWQQQTDFGGTWQGAIDYCDALTLGGASNWRLPSRRELMSIADYGRYNPSINPVFTGTTLSSEYWSSTPYAYDPEDAWMVYFFDGWVYNNLYKPYSSNVRCVR